MNSEQQLLEDFKENLDKLNKLSDNCVKFRAEQDKVLEDALVELLLT